MERLPRGLQPSRFLVSSSPCATVLYLQIPTSARDDGDEDERNVADYSGTDRATWTLKLDTSKFNPADGPKFTDIPP